MSFAALSRPDHDADFHAWALDQAERLPGTCPWAYEEIVGEWLPERAG